MPKLWTETMETHRSAVRDATLDAAAALATEHGLTSVTMSQVAQRAGIGRATLYKYFPDVESILLAWHERQVASHLRHLAGLGDAESDPTKRLEAVLEALALMSHGDHGTEIAAALHRGAHITGAHQQLHEFIRDLIAEGAKNGDLRGDVPAGELATFCLNALSPAGGATSKAAMRRLVPVTMAGLRPPP
jgi:AcrR family transcriptional regulator